MSYDVYYATGGGSMVYGGSDVWVNNWLREVAPKLNHPSKLLIHRRRPENVKIEFDFIITRDNENLNDFNINNTNYDKLIYKNFIYYFRK